MRILHTVESYYPAMGGMQEVVRQLSERLVKMGHEVTVATRKHIDRTSHECNGVKIADFEIEGNAVRGIKGDVDGYQNFLLEADFDIVTNFAAQQWATDIALPILQQIKGKKVNVPTGFSGLYDPAYAAYFVEMQSWMKQYDMNVFLSDDYRDINFARKHGISRNTLIPNGAAEDEFLPGPINTIREKLGIGKDDFFVLHVGSFTGIKGHKEAAEIFLRSAIENSTLVLIGNQNEYFDKWFRKSLKFRFLRFLNRKLKNRVIATSLSRRETVDAYLSADLFLFPSNIECSPIVLFECMAASLPFLTTDVGNSKEIISWSKGGELLPTTIGEDGYSRAMIAASAEQLADIHADKRRRNKLAEAGHQAWLKHFSWEIIAKQYEQLYTQLIQE
jgi:glycosyltransferase involved in cell wall biosynthesis